MIFLALAENSIQLVPDGTLFLHIAIILLMVFILNATLFKPINRILEEREKLTRGRSGEARDLLKRIEAKIASYERLLREVRTEGYQLMEQQRAEALRERQAALAALREEIHLFIAREKESIEAQKEQARAVLASDAERLAVEIGSHILRRPVGDGGVSTGQGA